MAMPTSVSTLVTSSTTLTLKKVVKTAKAAVNSYAAQKNSHYANITSHVVSAAQRWNTTFNGLDANTQTIYTNSQKSGLTHFAETYPHIKKWQDLLLAEAVSVKLIDVQIDITMQRELDIEWALSIIAKFKPTKVVPIQVYRDPDDNTKYIAWDGQHTLIALWIIAMYLKADFSTIEIPVNIYRASDKRSIRECLLDLNGKEGKKVFEPIDVWMQRVYGVRCDGVSHGLTNNAWLTTEKKQQHLEQYGLFVTATKFNDDHHPGAIINVQEVDHLPELGVKHLARYLSIVLKGNRPADGTEIELMCHFFHQCLKSNIQLSDKYVDDLAAVTLATFNADFSTNGAFWSQAKIAYTNWHTATYVDQENTSRLSKHKNHGFPFLIAQLQKSFAPLGHRVPPSNSTSSFWPDTADLF